MSMKRSTEWLCDDGFLSRNLSGSDHHVKADVKCEEGFDNQLHNGTCVKVESTVKEEVGVEREDQASLVQGLCLSANDGYGALRSAQGEQCIERVGGYQQEQAVNRPAGSGRYMWCPMVKVEGGGVCGREEEQGSVCMRDVGRESVMQPLVSLEDCKVEVEHVSGEETGVDRLGEGEEQEVQGGGCQQEQAVDRPASSGTCDWCPVVKVEGGGVCGSVCRREEEERRDSGRESVVQPLVSLGDCKVEVEPVFGEEASVKRRGEGEEQEVQGGVHLQAMAESSVATSRRWSVAGAQWSEGSTAPVASSSSRPEMSEPRPCVSSHNTAQLSPLEKRHGSPPRRRHSRKKARVQSPSSVVHQLSKEVSKPHLDVNTVHEGVKRHACSHCECRCARRDSLKRYVETVHEGLRKYHCPVCHHRASHNTNLHKHIQSVHEGSQKCQCSHCQHRGGQKGTRHTCAETVHAGSWKHKCPHCRCRAGSKNDLQKHMLIAHDGLKKPNSPNCRYRAGAKSHMQTQVERVHEPLVDSTEPACPSSTECNGSVSLLCSAVHTLSSVVDMYSLLFPT